MANDNTKQTTHKNMVARERIIRNYIQGYNQFDIDKMFADFDDKIVFENTQNGTTNMT